MNLVLFSILIIISFEKSKNDVFQYFKRSLSYLIGENHPNWNKPRPEETKIKISEANKNVPKSQFRWQTPEGYIKIMGKANATYWHPNWKLLGPIE